MSLYELHEPISIFAPGFGSTSHISLCNSDPLGHTHPTNGFQTKPIGVMKSLPCFHNKKTNHEKKTDLDSHVSKGNQSMQDRGFSYSKRSSNKSACILPKRRTELIAPSSCLHFHFILILTQNLPELFPSFRSIDLILC